MKTKANKKKRGLGKGLDDLMNDANSIINQSIDKGNASELPISSLRAGIGQPRKSFTDEALESLSTSIREHGVLQPLIVREVGDSYEIIAGERRYRASQRAGLKTVPVVILNIDNTKSSEIALVENIQREDLSPIEEADGYNRMITEFNYTQDMLSKAVGKSRPHIANTLRLLNLPEEVKTMINNNQLSAGHARTLVGVENAHALALEIINQGMSVRGAEEFVAREKNHSIEKSPTAKPVQSSDEKLAIDIIQSSLGLKTAVKISQNGKGKITISFENKGELESLLSTLK